MYKRQVKDLSLHQARLYSVVFISLLPLKMTVVKLCRKSRSAKIQPRLQIRTSKRFTATLTRTAVRLLPMSFAFMMRLLTIQSREQFSIRMQFGKQKCLITIPQRNFLCQSSRTASACMSHRQLRKSQPIAVSRLTFSGTRLSVLKIRITIMLTSQRNSMTSRLFCSISMKSDF